MRRTALALLVLAAACLAIAGAAGGAAASYPSPLELRSTASAVTGTWKLDTGTGAVDATTGNVPAQNDTGWYAWDPGASVTTQLATIPTTADGKGWIVDPAGGATGFPAGSWVFTVQTDIPDAGLTAGAAILTVGMWKGTFSGGAFTPTGTILTPTDDPGAQNLRTGTTPVTTSVTISVPKFSIAAGETLFVDFWRHQTAGINDATASRRQLDLLVNDGIAQLTHPTADDAGPTHAITITAVSGSTYFSSGASTLYYNGSTAGSFRVNDAITDTGAGPFSVSYPLVSTPGWTHSSETVTTGPSYQSSVYSWTADSTTAPGAQTITGEDLAVQQSTATLTVTNDSTGPTGQTVALSGGPAYSTLSIPLTLANGSDAGSGLDTSSGVVERASATLANGTCGTFGSFSSVTLTSSADTTVASGNCYRYQYKISDNVANQSAASAASADAKVDTSAPTVASTAPAEVTGAGDQYYNAATKTVFFRPAATGSFTLGATVTDAESGGAQVAFPDVSTTTGWSGSTGGTDTTSPYASTTYTWTANATAPGAKQITATNGTGLTATDTITFTADSSAPTGGSIALSGGPFYTALSVPLTITAGTDNSGGSGVDAARAVVERASATLAAGTCGTFGSFSAITLANGADTTVASGNCYRYRYKPTDNVGNVAATASTPSADAKVDTSGPVGPTLTFSALSGVGLAGTTLYYRAGASGSFTVTAAASDTQSGVGGYAFPVISGWTSTGSGTTRTYAFTGSPAEALNVGVTATSVAGTATAPTTFSLRADAGPPRISMRCNGRACISRPYKGSALIALSASDGLSGVDKILYTTNGTVPTPDTGTEYEAPFRISSTARIRFRAYDKVGNASAVGTRRVKVQTRTPLVFTVPKRLAVKLGNRRLQTKVRANANSAVVVVLTGPGLKKPERWSFNVRPGTSRVKLTLARRVQRVGRHKLTWFARSGQRKTRKVTQIVIRRPPTK